MIEVSCDFDFGKNWTLNNPEIDGGPGSLALLYRSALGAWILALGYIEDGEQLLEPYMMFSEHGDSGIVMWPFSKGFSVHTWQQLDSINAMVRRSVELLQGEGHMRLDGGE